MVSIYSIILIILIIILLIMIWKLYKSKCGDIMGWNFNKFNLIIGLTH
jgi:uncharacterized membrane protein